MFMSEGTAGYTKDVVTFQTRLLITLTAVTGLDAGGAKVKSDRLPVDRLKQSVTYFAAADCEPGLLPEAHLTQLPYI